MDIKQALNRHRKLSHARTQIDRQIHRLERDLESATDWRRRREIELLDERIAELQSAGRL